MDFDNKKRLESSMESVRLALSVSETAEAIGVSAKIISEALGHSSVAFTMDTYSHIIEGMQEDAMKLLDEVLPTGYIQSNNYNLTTILKI